MNNEFKRINGLRFVLQFLVPIVYYIFKGLAFTIYGQLKIELRASN